MNSKKEKMLAECMERMKILGMKPKQMKAFEKEQKIYVSEGGIILYELDEKQRQMVHEWERKHNCVVYHVLHYYMYGLEMYTFLYVAPSEDEWEMDRMELEKMQPFVYCLNVNIPEYSEFGSIIIKVKRGVVIRNEKEILGI